MHIPLRMCAACRAHRPKRELIRLMADEDTGAIVPAADNKATGRGVYICRNAECIRLAQKKRTAQKYLKMKASDDLYKLLEDMI